MRARRMFGWILMELAATVMGLGASVADASNWTISGSGLSTVGGFDFANVSTVLGDPSGSGSASTSGGIPLTFTRTATSFTLSGGGSSYDGECYSTFSFSGTGPIIASGGVSTATGAISGSGVDNCDGYSQPFTISGTFTAQSANAGGSGGTVVATVATVSGTATLQTPFQTAAITPGAALVAGTLVQTGADGNVAFDVQGGVRVAATPNSQVTLLPPAGSDAVVNQITGQLNHSRPGATSGGFRLLTATATVRPTGTQFTTRYTQTGVLGSTVVSVQSGSTEVEDRFGRRTTLLAGQQGAFDDTVPRVLQILPVDGGTVRGGVTNVFSWTAFPGAVGYRFEYTFRPTGFLARNPSTVEDPLLSVPLFPSPLLTQTGQTVELRLPMPLGVASGTRGYWRVFPLDGSARILPGTTASDGAAVLFE